MHGIQQHAENSPHPQDTLLPRLFLVQPEHAYRRIVEAIQDIRTSREVVQFLREIEVSSMEDHAEGPTGEADVSKPKVVSPQRIGRRYLIAELLHAPMMRKVVEEREDDTKGLLHAHEAVERPFTVKLVDGLHVRRVAREPTVGYNVLACVVALGGTIPEEDAAMESCER